MSPTLNDGDYLITFKPRTLRVGFLYVIQHARMGRIVKRLIKINQNSYSFAGDNSDSSSTSDKIGDIKRDQIIGRALFVVTPIGLKRL